MASDTETPTPYVEVTTFVSSAGIQPTRTTLDEAVKLRLPSTTATVDSSLVSDGAACLENSVGLLDIGAVNDDDNETCVVDELVDERFACVNHTGVGGRVFRSADMLTPISRVSETAEGLLPVKTAIGRCEASDLDVNENTGFHEDSGSDRNSSNSTALTNKASVTLDHQCNNQSWGTVNATEYSAHRDTNYNSTHHSCGFPADTTGHNCEVQPAFGRAEANLTEEETNNNEPVMISEMSNVDNREECTKCVTTAEINDNLVASEMDSLRVISPCDFLTCDNPDPSHTCNNCSDLFGISANVNMPLPSASYVGRNISSSVMMDPHLANHYPPTELYISDSETVPEAEYELLAAVTDGCSVDAKSSNCSEAGHSAIPPSTSVDRIHSSGITHQTHTKPLVKVSSAFIDLSASPVTQRQNLGRDRARSESGKDSVTMHGITSDKAELPPKKASAKRVNSIRKSLIKLGSFGKEHINGRGKSKKDKEREKNKTENQEFPLKRTGSDRVSAGPFSLALPSLQNQKSPEARLSGRFVTSPSPTLQADISLPQAVDDPKKLEQFSKVKMDTMQMMYDQARRECEELKQEYQKKPSEIIHTNLEAKVKVVRRLESQLSMYAGDSDGPSGDKRFCRRGSSIDGSILMVDGERDPTTRPPAPPPHYVPRHKGSDAGVSKTSSGNPEVSLSRSHSDSYKRIKKATGDGLRFTASTDEIQKLIATGSSEFDIGSRPNSESRSRSKSQEAASDNSSDPALNHLAPLSEHQTPMSASSTHDSLDGSKQLQSNIIALDDYEFASDEENPTQFEEFGSPFSDFSLLQTRPAHMAVFLHYLISNSDASPLLFYLLTGPYSQGGIKELRKWAYEIFSTFLVEKAPLKVKVDDSFLEQIHDILLNKYDKEEPMRNIFVAVREKAVLSQINELLADFRSKRALGLGGIYGDHELKEGLNNAAALKIVESVLWKHFTIAYDDDSERSQVLASALATFFKQIGYTNMRNAHLQDRCLTFNTKDKPKFSVFGKAAKREKSFSHRNHQFVPQHYYFITNCHHCQSVLFGVGNQGYQCQKCDLNFHKSCLEKISEPCLGRKSGKPSNMLDKLMKKPSIAAAAVGMEARMERTISMPCVRDVSGRSSLSNKASFAGLNFWDKSKGHKDTGAKGAEKADPPKTIDEIKSIPPFEVQPITENVPSEEHHHDPHEIAKPPPSYTSSIVLNVSSYSSEVPPSYSSLTITDSDLDVEQDLPPLEIVIPKEHLKRLEKKEKKRQEVINELFYTEKTHLRDIRVMQRLFYLPMHADPSFTDLANLVFPRINEIVEFHSNLNNEFKRIRSASENGVICDFAEVLVTYFSGERGANFKGVCGQFCEKQSKAQEQLKARQRKDPKLVTLLQEAASNPLCRRLTLKDFLPIPMQRLTKYPLLIENLIKYTPSDSEECVRLRSALDCSREILFSVNKAVNDYENQQKLLEIHQKLDKRPLENSRHPDVMLYLGLNVMDYTLLFDGQLTWRISRDRVIPLHVVLLDSILLLLQKQDDSRLVLRCESTLITAGREDTKTTHSPIIKLSNLIIRPVATDRCAFFLVSISEIGPQIYDLVAGSRDEKNKWWKHITSAVEANRDAEQFQFKKAHFNSQKTSGAESNFVTQEHEQKHEGLESIYDEDEEVAEVQEKVDSAVSLALASHQMDDEQYFAPGSNSSAIDSSRLSTASLDPLDQLKQVDDLIHRMMCEKKKILLQMCSESALNTDDKSEFYNEPCSQNDTRFKVLSTLLETDQLMRLMSNHCTRVGSENAVHASDAHVSDSDKLTPDSDVTVSSVPGSQHGLPTSLNISQLTELSSCIHRRLTELLESVIRSEEEKQKLLMDLQLAQEKLAILELPHSDDQPAANESSDQKLEPPADDETITDLQEKKTLPSYDILPPASESKESESTVAASQTIGADTDVDTSPVVAHITASENLDNHTAVSIQLSVDNVDNNSTDA